MEGGHGGVELLGHGAHGRRADRPTQDRQERARHLAGREPEHEAGQDHAIDVSGAAGIGPHHLERAAGPRARHVQLDHAELGQQVTAIAAVAAIGLAKLGHELKMLVDRLVHPTFQQLSERLPGTGAIILAPFHALCLHGLQHLKGNR
jgi:hypothetical protein